MAWDNATTNTTTISITIAHGPKQNVSYGQLLGYHFTELTTEGD